MKILTVLGARPQFIKAATVSRAVRSRDGIEEVLVHTGQHYDGNMSDVFFDELEIPKPDWNLGIGSGRHGEQTGKMLREIEKVLVEELPDWTLVYGDTNSTLAGALTSVKLGIPVAHVEAGLRSFNQYQPEEINRVATDAIAQLLFAPTKGAEDLLLAAGHASEKVFNVGDVMYDAALFTAPGRMQRLRYWSDVICDRAHIFSPPSIAPRTRIIQTDYEQSSKPWGWLAKSAPSFCPYIQERGPRLTRVGCSRRRRRNA